MVQNTSTAEAEAIECVHDALDTQSAIEALAVAFEPVEGTDHPQLVIDVLDTMVGSIAKALASASERGVSSLPSALFAGSRAALTVVDMARGATLAADWERAATHLLAAQGCVDALADYNRT